MEDAAHRQTPTGHHKQHCRQVPGQPLSSRQQMGIHVFHYLFDAVSSDVVHP
jgi:hypothetical protein